MRSTFFYRRAGEVRRYTGILALLGALAVGAVIGPAIGQSVGASGAAAQQIALPSPQQLSSEFGKITKQVGPAVVNINTESTVRAAAHMRGPDMGDNPLGDLFDRFFDDRGMPGAPAIPSPDEDFKQRSLGSGVIIDPSGYILTNRHVVNRADKIKVKMHDDPKSYDAKVIGTDNETDLAIIKVEAEHPLPYAKLGNSDALEVGDWVLAIGSPFGLEETVTAGIVSAKGRDLGSPFQRFVQTDAAINPGNSGGPLVNMAGEVVGINTQIASNNGTSAGVGFAVPSNTAIDVYEQITKSGKVSRGSIGITFQGEQNDALLRSFGAKNGVVVTSVREGGPAAKAGLKQGDVIVSVKGTAITDGDKLVSTIAALPIGENVPVRYIRDRREQQTSITIGDRATVLAELTNPNDSEEPAEAHEQTKAKFGISIQNLTPAMARQMGMEEAKGVVVSRVERSSFADELGMRSGDVIVEINQRPVTNVEDVVNIQQDLKSGSDVVFLVQRSQGGRSAPLYLAGTLS
jgi:serine protease Do